jgi:DNA-binding FadR family transcriptional regulator
VLESAAVKLAADRRDRASLADAREALAQMQAADVEREHLEAFDAADLRFHVALVRASGNEAMHLVMLALRDVAVRYLLAALAAQRDPRRLLRRLISEHDEILRAVEAGEADRAANLAESHIRRFYRSYGRTAAAPAAG